MVRQYKLMILLEGVLPARHRPLATNSSLASSMITFFPAFKDFSPSVTPYNAFELLDINILALFPAFEEPPFPAPEEPEVDVLALFPAFEVLDIDVFALFPAFEVPGIDVLALFSNFESPGGMTQRRRVFLHLMGDEDVVHYDDDDEDDDEDNEDDDDGDGDEDDDDNATINCLQKHTNKE